jgi:excisionase family DNA binding protein
LVIEQKTLSPREAFKVLGISERTGYPLLRSKRLHHIKIGNKTLIPTWAIDELLIEGFTKNDVDKLKKVNEDYYR